ncbi:hypothetical protein JZO70_19445 [Enterococcus sp. 669A]|uniref:Phage protein n=1 Tax=Candidatus Enterococcus moelleringii TaxID=2815325 RepID=A0ABS3LFF1_9ENTE|nr:hypothetical protein [Enterococcus sp. 669A]MBO1308360.1 hypothetical protein [Enterococcus sp. 669A]
MTVKLSILLEDALLQLEEFTGERHRTAELYKKLLNDIAEEHACLDDLTDRAEKMAIGDDAKKDLLKMVEYNYKYFENKKKATSLMDQYHLNDTPLKPLAEVVH